MSEFNVALGRYVIMPDHLHFFIRGDQTFVLGDWIKGLKRTMSEAFPTEQPPSLWQPGFFDHLLRNDESYAQKWDYVRENPVRAGLVKLAYDWPYQGEIVHIDRA
jgi:REP element-mobilizing transposase RayT